MKSLKEPYIQQFRTKCMERHHMEYAIETGQYNMPEEINFKKREGSISMRETLVWEQLAALLLGR